MNQEERDRLKGLFLRALAAASTPAELHEVGWNRRKPGDSWCFLVVPPRLAGELDKKDLYEVLGSDCYPVLSKGQIDITLGKKRLPKPQSLPMSSSLNPMNSASSAGWSSDSRAPRSVVIVIDDPVSGRAHVETDPPSQDLDQEP
ncbi:hypothetical protein [Holophaga foetida]|uniref:hypothetical protein n=1 Tax=Holophaga foetida TaxID=35839 RepID=UPI0002472112|nr:hypothetical protein [Holophaga foetida]